MKRQIPPQRYTASSQRQSISSRLLPSRSSQRRPQASNEPPPPARRLLQPVHKVVEAEPVIGTVFWQRDPQAGLPDMEEQHRLEMEEALTQLLARCSNHLSSFSFPALNELLCMHSYQVGEGGVF